MNIHIFVLFGEEINTFCFTNGRCLFPNQGPVITIKLSEHTECAKDTSQNQLVEMLFEMNYDTGHWRRLKRTRVLAKQQPANQVNQ